MTGRRQPRVTADDRGTDNQMREIAMSGQSVKPTGTDTRKAPHVPRLAHAFGALHNDMNQLFNRFLNGMPFHTPFGTPHPRWLDYGFASPAVDVTEDERSYRVAVELPGVAADDFEVSTAGDTLTVRGEKREEAEEKGRTVHLFERSYGSFQRAFHLPDGIDRDRIDAHLDKGVLVITLPKLAGATADQARTVIKIG
jgi:HSP20 family protein